MQENEEIVSYIRRAFELKSQECYKQAIEMLYKAFEIEPDNIEILYQTGELYFLLHNYERALRYLEKVLAEDENHIPALQLMCSIMERQNNNLEAVEYGEKVYELRKDNDSLINLIKLYGKCGCVEKLESLQKQNSSDVRCLYECANAFYKNKEIAKASEILVSVDIDNPENEDCKILAGKIYFDKNEFEKSREIFNSFSKTSSNAEVLNYKGLFELEDMNFVEAVKYFSKAANIAKTNAVYFFNLGNAYFFNGWQEEAAAAYKKAVGISPENLDYRYALAYLYYERKEYDKTQKEVDYILENNSEHSQAKVLLALLKLHDKDFLGSKKVLEENISAGCSDDFTLISLGKVYKELDMYEKAAVTIRKVIGNSPENLSYMSELADIYIKEKKYDSAIELAEKVIEENEKFISAYIIGANAAYLKGDFETAKDFAQGALALDINCSEGYYYLALARVEEEDYDEAVECMKRAITFDVNNAKYYAAMSNIYKLKNDIKTAFEYIKEAESIDNSTEYKIMYRDLAALNRKK